MVSELLTGTDPTASWILAITSLVAVSAVVGLLLHLVAATSAGIKSGVADVWAGGQRVANNTIHIAKAYEIADGVEAILGHASKIAESSEAIRAHAASCPGCPACFLGEK
ncbi:MAG: hypothetical protein H0W39_10855 [Sphingomonas sp.]|nr:hypothetical protein [Sphingomonas sp.]